MSSGKVEEGASGAVPNPSAQRDLVKHIIDDSQALREGDVWYPIAFKWWQVWQMYVDWESTEETKDDGGGVNPGPVDNGPLCKDGFDGVLKFGLREDYDHVLIPAKVWDNLVAWYGGGPAFPRKVIVSELTFQARIEMYPQYCRARSVGDDGSIANDEVVLMLGRGLTASEALEEVASKFNVAVEASRLWARVQGQTEFGLANPSMTIGDIAGDDDMTELLVETQTRAGEWKRTPPAAAAGDGGDATEPEADAEPFDEAKWREELKVGDRCDAQDTDKKWFESVVKEVESTPQGDKLLVHYRGWSSKWDAWIERSSSKLQPRFTKAKDFRDFRINDHVEYKHNNRWFEAVVKALKDDGSQVKVNAARAHQTVWVDRDSEHLCALGTHCSKHREPTYYNFRKSTAGRPVIAGAVGLQNLGNTCFMNSMLQCLSNSEPLTKFFMSGEYRKDINTNNPLGMGGRLAEAYGDLLAEMWGSKYTVVCPTGFKRQIGAYAPQFAGYQQQDSQELMNFLLDGLHEDLNRVKKKPATETVESKGRPDDVVAREAWATHQLRNRSMVVDTFQGQLKSDVTCDQCGRQSVTFDPFMSLSVPIPIKHLRNLLVTFIPYDGAAPVRYSAKVEKAGCIADLKAWLHETDGFDPDTLVVADTYRHRICRTLGDRDRLSSINDNDIIMIYQLPALAGEPKPESMLGRIRSAVGARATNDAETKHTPGCVQLMYRHDDVVHGVSRKVPHGDPRIVSLFSMSGERGVLPTNNQVRAAVFEAIKRLLVNRADIKPDALPFTIVVAPKSGSAVRSGKEVPANDTKIAINLAKDALFVEFTSEQYRAQWDFEELVKWVPHASVDERVTQHDIDVGSCLDMFSKREQLGENDKWYCSACKEHRRAYKKFDLWKLPDVLIVHLKRFSYSQGVYFVHRDKIENLVHFPKTLDLASRVLGPQPDGSTFELFAVSNHSGGLGGGHYTAFAKNFRDGAWYNFNDSHVSKLSDESRLVSSMAYVLFYKRVKTTAPTKTTAPRPAPAPPSSTPAAAAAPTPPAAVVTEE